MRHAEWAEPRPGTAIRMWARAAVLVLLMLASGLAMAQDPGFIEINAEDLDGADVFLDDTHKGVIESDELLISTVYPGRYTLRVESPGFFPYALEVEVAPGQVTGVALGTSVPNPNSRTESRVVGATLGATTATFTLQCFPMACSLTILDGPGTLGDPRGGVTEFAKTFGDAILIVDDLPTGEYTLRVASIDRGALELTSGICHEETIAIVADFTRDPVDLTLTRSGYPNCPPLPVQTEATPDDDR